MGFSGPDQVVHRDLKLDCHAAGAGSEFHFSSMGNHAIDVPLCGTGTLHFFQSRWKSSTETGGPTWAWWAWTELRILYFFEGKADEKWMTIIQSIKTRLGLGFLSLISLSSFCSPPVFVFAIWIHMGVSENRLNPFLPNGFADHDPYEKWLAIIGKINPTFSDTPIWITWSRIIYAASGAAGDPILSIPGISQNRCFRL